MDLLDVFERGTGWTATKIPGAEDKLESSTPCDEWDVRALLNHLLQSLDLFAGATRGESPKPPPGMPAELVGDDPVAQYEQARQTTLDAYREPGVIEKTGGRSASASSINSSMDGTSPRRPARTPRSPTVLPRLRSR